MLSGVESQIHRTSFEERLFAPGPEQLIGREQIESPLLLANRRRAGKDREKSGFARDYQGCRDGKENYQNCFWHCGHHLL